MLRKATGVLSFDISDGASTAHWSVVLKKGDVLVSRAHDEADCVVTTDRPLFDVEPDTNVATAFDRFAPVITNGPSW